MNSHLLQIFVAISYHVATVYCSDCITDSAAEQNAIKVIDPLFEKSVEVKDASGNFSYSISFCKKLDNDAGVLQTTLKKEEAETHVVGKVTSTDIKIGSSWIFLTYKDGDHYGSHCGSEGRQAHIFILCGSSLGPDHVTIIEENNNKSQDCYYLFEMQSSIACPPSSMSFGWILVIIILCLSAAYLLLGFLYQRFVQRAKGKEQIPNLSFWRKFGNTAADGCNYVCRCTDPNEARSYKGLGDDQLGLDEDEERDENILPMY